MRVRSSLICIFRLSYEYQLSELYDNQHAGLRSIVVWCRAFHEGEHQILWHAAVSTQLTATNGMDSNRGMHMQSDLQRHDPKSSVLEYCKYFPWLVIQHESHLPVNYHEMLFLMNRHWPWKTVHHKMSITKLLAYDKKFLRKKLWMEKKLPWTVCQNSQCLPWNLYAWTACDTEQTDASTHKKIDASIHKKTDASTHRNADASKHQKTDASTYEKIDASTC